MSNAIEAIIIELEKNKFFLKNNADNNGNSKSEGEESEKSITSFQK